MSLMSDFVKSQNVAKLIAEAKAEKEKELLKAEREISTIFIAGLEVLESQIKSIIDTGELPPRWEIVSCPAHGDEFVGHYDQVTEQFDIEFKIKITTNETKVYCDIKDEFLKRILPNMSDVDYVDGKYMRNGYEIVIDDNSPGNFPSGLGRLLGMSRLN